MPAYLSVSFPPSQPDLFGHVGQLHVLFVKHVEFEDLENMSGLVHVACCNGVLAIFGGTIAPWRIAVIFEEPQKFLLFFCSICVV